MFRNTSKVVFVLLITAVTLIAVLPAGIAGQQGWNYINPPEVPSNASVTVIPVIGISPQFLIDNTMYMTNGWAIYESKDGGKNWAEPHKTHNQNQTYLLPENPSTFYGAVATTKTPTARIHISPNFNSSGLVVISNTEGHYEANLSPGSFVSFMGITPRAQYGPVLELDEYQNGVLHRIERRGVRTIGFLQGFAFGPDGTMYAASAQQIFYVHSNQLRASNLEAWKELSYIGDYTYDIKLSPNFSNDQTMIIQTGRGVLISTDGGKKFTQTSLPLVDGYYDLEFSPNYATDGTIAAIIPDAGLFLSTDRGASWKNVFPSKGLIATSIGPSGAIYVGADYTYDTQNGVYVSYDEGLNWQGIGLEGSKITSLYTLIGVDGDLVYAGTDSNLAWTTVAQSVQ